ncbi:codanin-1 [Oryzias melastigma]|uniref:codanin-1 n=1 Tax=Oryzias melastigma TaxID=30732 RepID=UPI000CF7E916|nr:codanin-1 [Oryzias melastigma]
MAAILDLVLSRRIDPNKVVEWLKTVQERDSLPFTECGVTVQKHQFVSFLLNFLREQSSPALAHGTPAKTPNRPRPAAQTGGLSERRACRSAGSATTSRSSSRVQLFSPSSSVSPGAESDAAGQLSGVSAFSSPSFSTTWNPASRPSGSDRRHGQRVSLGDFMTSPPDMQPSPFQSQKSRKKNMALGAQGRGGRGSQHSDEMGFWDTGSKKPGRGGGHSRSREQLSPPSTLNFNNLEDFPPVGSSPISPLISKPSRRINPTPVSAERPRSKPKTCFTSTPFTKLSSPPMGAEVLDGSMRVGSPLSLQEERELLKREKSKRAQQPAASSPCLSSLEPCTPPKTGVLGGAKVTPELQTLCPERSKVTFTPELDLLAELYCACISENLVPNIFLELFFVMQLLTSMSPPSNDAEEQESFSTTNSDVLERCYLKQVHNCVYFAVTVLENQFQLVAHLDKGALRLLAENERVASFSPALRDLLIQAQGKSSAKLSPSVSTFIHSVPFQPDTDNRSNFGNDKAFHTFKKQRDVFYEALREWEDLHNEPGWNFDASLGGRIRGMMNQLTSAGNHSHFARLFLKQLVQMCKGPRMSGAPGEPPDADLLEMLGADGLGRLKRLEERLIQPHGIVGPCPPPSFPGHQEFFRDFIQTASCCQLNQHLQDSLCQQLLQLDEVSILSPSASIKEEDEDGDMEQQDEKQRFSSVLLLARLLAKFLGFISFLPYQTSERPSREIQEASVALRSKSVPVLDVCAVLDNSVRRRRTILTVPWLVEFLSMLDFVGPLLLCYRTALGTLLLLYRRLQLRRCADVCYLNKLLLVSVLGWLFHIPAIPDDFFFTAEFTAAVTVEDGDSGSVGLDCIPLVDQQLLYFCCPFLSEFRKLLAAFVSGSTAKSGGIIRKITPTSAELKDTPIANRSQQKLQGELEQAFFHNQPPSLRRTVEFVAERVGSNSVKHMKATLVSELMDRGEKILRDKLKSLNFNTSKLNESICALLCDAGLEALERATRFCDEKSLEAVRTLLPEETSPTVLRTSESITKRLAAEKACSWLSANITVLIRREWKIRFDRVMKALGSPDSVNVSGAEVDPIAQDRPVGPKKKPGSERAMICPPGCDHSAALPSDVLIEMKELLSIAVGPRTEAELPAGSQIKALLHRARDTLACRKFQTAVSEQMLLNSTVLLACKLVTGELPVLIVSSGSDTVESEVLLPDLLEQLAELWEMNFLCPDAFHQLFAPLTVTALLTVADSQATNYLFLVRRLVDKGLLSEEAVISHWSKLTDMTWPVELIKNFQLQSQRMQLSPPAAEMLKSIDRLQVSQQPLEGAT